MQVHFPSVRTAQVKCLLFDRTIPLNLYSLWPTVIFSYNLTTFLSSGENSIKTNFESAVEVKSGSHVEVSQSGQVNLFQVESEQQKQTVARSCNSAHIFAMQIWSHNLLKLSYLELPPFGMPHKVTGRLLETKINSFHLEQACQRSFLQKID